MIGFLKRLFGGNPESDKIEEVAERVERFADRFRNADDEEGAEIAEQYAAEIRNAKTLEEAYSVESEFMQKIKDRLPFGKRGTSSHIGGMTHHHYHDNDVHTTFDSVDSVAGIYGSDSTSSSDSADSAEGDGGDFSGAGSSTEFESGETFSDNS